MKLLEALSRGRKPGEDEDDRKPTNLRAAVCLEACFRLSICNCCSVGVSHVYARSCAQTSPEHVHCLGNPQLLGEMEGMFGPFSRIIRTLRHELANCVYSNYYVSQDGSTTFDQVPFFTAAERLESEKEALLLERSRFLRELAQRNADVGARQHPAPASCLSCRAPCTLHEQQSR